MATITRDTRPNRKSKGMQDPAKIREDLLRPLPRMTIRILLTIIITVAVFSWGMAATDFSAGTLVEGVPNIVDFVSRLFPMEFEYEAGTERVYSLPSLQSRVPDVVEGTERLREADPADEEALAAMTEEQTIGILYRTENRRFHYSAEGLEGEVEEVPFILEPGQFLFIDERASDPYILNEGQKFVDRYAIGVDQQLIAKRYIINEGEIFLGWPILVGLIIETVQIALIGTAGAVLLSIPFGLLAARNVSPHPIVYQVTRVFMNAGRAIPELIFALIFVAAVGLGPFPGVLAMTLVISGVSAQDDREGWPSPFVLGLFGGDDSAETLRDNEPLRAYLAETLGMEVVITTGTSYGAVIEAMRADRVDAMAVGPFAFVLAEREADAEPIAVLLVEGVLEGFASPDEVEALRPYYYSVFVTKKGSGIDSLDDLEGQDVAFVDPASTSGRNAPVVRLINEIEGLETPADVDAWLNPIFAGSHPSAVTALIEDQVAVAATFEGNLLNMRNEGLAEVCGFEDDRVGVTLTQEDIDAIYADCPEGNLVVIAQSNPIPNTPMAVRTELPESFKLALQEALLAIKDDPELLAQVGYYFVDPTEYPELGLESINDFYNVVRDIAAITAAN